MKQYLAQRIHPLTLYRLTDGHPSTEYVKIFDGIKDENTLNELDSKMLPMILKIFAPRNNI